MSYHRPVMLNECLEGLNIDEKGIYVDLTFGGGGHSQAILERLDGGRLLGFDQDSDAAVNADRFPERSFTFIAANFRHLKKYLRLHGITTVNGILVDLGVSSHQIDAAERGFSTRFDAELDMRMNQGASLSAKEVLNEYDEGALHRMFGIYGEVKNARTLASAIVSSRVNRSLDRVGQFIELLKPIAPRGREFKYYAQVFQAIRIEVNEEMKALEEMLMQTAEVLNEGGRLVIMSYHSLEDRMVKNFMNKGKLHGEVERDLYGNMIRDMRQITRKPITASAEEIAENNRARSAKLRIAERI
ncbi:MAG: 16S rRNA (cytosine(1402)-N(4))-methyltransferase RsmH [Cyclobacteriaceae bacterium]